jgi:protein SCO1/2|tara:strand:+ start:829 stop:1488 length:660 start_codon:yes stop_codon:yes gene_type:complete
MQSIKSTVGLCVVFISIVLVMFVFSKMRVPELSADEMRSQGVFILPTPRDIGPFELLDHRGTVFNRQSLEGHWSFIFFGFTNCPDVCPTSLSVLGQVENQLKKQDPVLAEGFKVRLVSVDPDADTLERLGQYVSAFSPSFLGVRGERADLVKFTDQVNVAFAKVPLRSSVPGSDEMGYTVDHTGNIVIINPRGHYHGFIKLPHKAETIRLSYQTLDAQF